MLKNEIEENAEKEQKLSGCVEEVMFYNENNGYIVFDLSSEDEPVTVVGELGQVDEGETVTVRGVFQNHSRFGRQFHAFYCERQLPKTSHAIEKYLASGSIKGIGPTLAHKIVTEFGEQTLDIMEHDPHRLEIIKGISPTKCEAIAAEYRQLFGIRTALSFFSQYGVPSVYAMKAYKLHGSDTIKYIRDNPYAMCKAEIGYTFPRAQEFADNFDFDDGEQKRIRAGLLFILEANLSQGHTCLPLDRYIELAKRYLEAREQDVYDAYNYELEEKNIIEYERDDNTYVYLLEYFTAESFIAVRLGVLNAFMPQLNRDFNLMIDAEEKNSGIVYDEIQREAIALALTKGMIIMTGGPGTGKTTTLNAIISIYEMLDKHVLLAAPTGRAAKRLSELTHCDASTIHRLLEAQISPDNGEMYFARDAENPLECDALIIDETSMVDLLLMHKLLLALPEDATLILVGDPDQLPSVGAGSLFSDLITAGNVRTVALTEIFRQARESLIVMNAHAVNRGELPVLNAKDRDVFFLRRMTPESVAQTVCDLCATRLPSKMGIPASEIQVITPSRKGETGTFALNRALQAALNPPTERKREMICGATCFREGDRVMQIRNNYDMPWKGRHGEYGTGVFNGDVGEIVRIDPREDAITICFDEREAVYEASKLVELELAYAMTAHKSQGSEYRAVIFVPFAGAPRLLTRGVLYTAITRARELLVMVGNEEVIAQMTQNNRRNKRYSALRLRLRGQTAP